MRSWGWAMTAAMTEAGYAPTAGLLLRLGEPAKGGSVMVQATACPMSEAELTLIWQGQRFPPEALRTPDGRRVGVLHPGRRGGGAGPDFLDAAVLLDGGERRGDVELHVRASAFRAHGHDRDPAYDRLVLHVVYLADDGVETPLAGGGRAPVAAFAPWLERRAADLARWLAAPAIWQEPCRSALARLGAAAVAAELTAAGGRRFGAKVERLAAAAAALGEEAALWRAVLEALGVGGDRAGFRRLAVLFPPALARSVGAGRLEAALLYLAGLGPAPDCAAALPAPLSPALAAAGGRPANRPQRRLAAFVRLVLRAEGDLASYVLASVARAVTARALVAAWQVAGEGDGAAPLGQERARELVLNAVLPFAATQPELRAKAEALLRELPAVAPYGKTAFLEANLRGPDGRRAAASALAQQGLLAFLEEWCSRGGCGRCPLS